MYTIQSVGAIIFLWHWVCRHIILLFERQSRISPVLFKGSLIGERVVYRMQPNFALSAWKWHQTIAWNYGVCFSQRAYVNFFKNKKNCSFHIGLRQRSQSHGMKGTNLNWRRSPSSQTSCGPRLILAYNYTPHISHI